MTTDNGRYGGGRPPSLAALAFRADYNTEQVCLFVNFLFGKYQQVEGASDPEFHRLLLASVLLRLPQLLLALKEHPKQKFGTTDVSCYENHCFLKLLLIAANRALMEDPICTLNSWARTIEVDFHKCNFMFVPLKDVDHTNDSVARLGDFDERPLRLYEESCCRDWGIS